MMKHSGVLVLGRKTQGPWEVQRLQPFSTAFPCPPLVLRVSLLLCACANTWLFQPQRALPHSTRTVHNGFQMYSQVILFLSSDRRF